MLVGREIFVSSALGDEDTMSLETSGKPNQVTWHHIPEDLKSLNQSVVFSNLKHLAFSMG
jgi:hypothetical protein